MFGTYVGRGRMLITTTFGAKLLASADDLSLTPDLVVSGEYDTPFTNYLRRNLSAGQVAIDVGANIGLFTLLMAWQVGPTGKVVAFECDPDNLTLLRENVALNYASWAEVRSEAVGAESGTATLHRTSRFQGNGSLIEHDDRYFGRQTGLDEFEAITVDMVRLDEQLAGIDQIDLVKVDTEGNEFRVLQGLRGLIGGGRITRLSVEVVRARMPEDDWEPFCRFVRELAAAGWRYATIETDGSTIALRVDELIERGAFSQVLFEAPRS